MQYATELLQVTAIPCLNQAALPFLEVSPMISSRTSVFPMTTILAHIGR